MRRFFVGLAAFVATLSSAGAQTCGGSDLIARMKLDDPARYDRLTNASQAVEFGQARLFRISKGKAQPSYLFGTMHSSDPRALAWVDRVEPLLAKSRALAVENTDVNPSQVAPAAAMKFATMMVARPNELLADHLTPAELDGIADLAAPKMSLSPPAVKRLRPWALILSLAYPACETERQKIAGIVDFNLVARAEARRIPVRSLETVDEMLSALLEPPLATQIDMLRSAYATHMMAEDLLESMTRMLDRGDTGFLSVYARDESLKTLKDPASYDIFMRSLIDRRNGVMVRNALPLLEKGGAFIAVGALHLPGPTGLAKQFADAGYKVEPMTLERATTDK